jgi:ABC-type glycerol-3-phosphate transport system substrate-binding protein
MFKKILAALIAVSAVVLAVSCKQDSAADASSQISDKNGSGEYTYDDDGNVVKDDAYYFGDLADADFEGYDFRILVRKTHTGTQYFEEPQEDIVDNSIYERNKAVEEKYNIGISIHETSNNNYETDALNSILAGDDAYDIIFTHSRSAFTYAVRGACVNFNDVKAIHLDKPWWSQDITDSCNINGRLFVLDGDISTSSLEAAMCMFFNKRIFDELGYDYPYELVDDGEWTFDEFAYYAKKGGADLDGNGVMDTAVDQFGFGANGSWHAPINIIYTGGQKIYDKTDDGLLELSLYSNKTVDIYDEYFALMGNEACSPKMGISDFKVGRLMMSAGALGDAKTLRAMDDEFGIIPYPKFTEDDKYATVTNGGAPLLIMPITVSDVERTGAITEALCAYGSKLVIPAFYDKALKTKYSRDDDSERMMDIVKDSIIFDLGYLTGSLMNTGKELGDSPSPDFASYYAERENEAKAKLETFLEDYAGIEE